MDMCRYLGSVRLKVYLKVFSKVAGESLSRVFCLTVFPHLHEFDHGMQEQADDEQDQEERRLGAVEPLFADACKKQQGEQDVVADHAAFFGDALAQLLVLADAVVFAFATPGYGGEEQHKGRADRENFVEACRLSGEHFVQRIAGDNESGGSGNPAEDAFGGHGLFLPFWNEALFHGESKRACKVEGKLEAGVVFVIFDCVDRLAADVA